MLEIVRRGHQAVRFDPLADALDDEGACGRVVEPGGEDFLVFGGIVPPLDRSFVGEFKDDDAFGLRPALDQFGGSGPGEEGPPYCSQVAPTAAWVKAPSLPGW